MQSKTTKFNDYIKLSQNYISSKFWEHLGTKSARLNGDIYRLPPFLWRGDSGQGKWLCQGYFSTTGQRIAHNNVPWQNDTIMHHPFWSNFAHGFHFLCDLRALGGDNARQMSRYLVQSWIEQNKKQKLTQSNCGITAARISNWLLHYDFFGQTAHNDFVDVTTQSLLRQVQSLAHFPQKHIPPAQSLQVAKALILTGICITEQEHILERGLKLLKHSLDTQILYDGSHISKNPQTLLNWACDASDIHHTMQRAHFYEADYLPSTIDRMAAALRFFSAHAGELPFFHSCSHPESERLQHFFKVYDNNKKRKSSQALEDSGYYKLQKGRICLIADGGSLPSFPYNSNCHASLSAFELYIGKEKLITNCGSHPLSADFAHNLKYSAAHSTLILDDRNSCEILADGYIGRASESPQITYRELADKSLSLDIVHNGYMPTHTTTHSRHIEMSQDGLTIKGMDSLISETHRTAPLEYTLRFHLHPMVQCSLIKGSSEALLRLPSGKSANFYAYGYNLRIEESIMMGKNLSPRPTKQLVIEGRYSGGLEQMPWIISIKS
jgi:uncharacterized heparinase superfamily protein